MILSGRYGDLYGRPGDWFRIRETPPISRESWHVCLKILLFLRQIFLAIALFTMSSFFKDTIVLINIKCEHCRKTNSFTLKVKPGAPTFTLQMAFPS